MKVAVYLVVIPGADRVYVSGTYPDSFVKTKPGSKLFRVDVFLPGLELVDGTLVLLADEVGLDIRAKIGNDPA